LAIKRSGYKIFADFRREQLTFWKIPSCNTKKKKELCQTQHPRNWSLRGRKMKHQLPQLTKEEQHMQKRKLLIASNLTSAVQRTPSKGTWSDK
jgi:hypothetical protein